MKNEQCFILSTSQETHMGFFKGILFGNHHDSGNRRERRAASSGKWSKAIYYNKSSTRRYLTPFRKKK